MILGIGVNVNFPWLSMPEEIRYRATSVLDLTGVKVSRESVLGAIDSQPRQMLWRA